jgi:hypothetical protein
LNGLQEKSIKLSEKTSGGTLLWAVAILVPGVVPSGESRRSYLQYREALCRRIIDMQNTTKWYVKEKRNETNDIKYITDKQDRESSVHILY